MPRESHETISNANEQQLYKLTHTRESPPRRALSVSSALKRTAGEDATPGVLRLIFFRLRIALCVRTSLAGADGGGQDEPLILPAKIDRIDSEPFHHRAHIAEPAIDTVECKHGAPSEPPLPQRTDSTRRIMR